jgi:hypothetical protein
MSPDGRSDFLLGVCTRGFNQLANEVLSTFWDRAISPHFCLRLPSTNRSLFFRALPCATTSGIPADCYVSNRAVR